MARKKFQWSREGDDPDGEVHFTERTPRNELRRRKTRVNQLGRNLVNMKADQLREVEMPEAVAEAVSEARRLVSKGNVKGGMKRQMLFVSAVLRGVDETDFERMFDDMSRVLGRR